MNLIYMKNLSIVFYSI